MSRIAGDDADNWINKKHPKNGMFRVYWAPHNNEFEAWEFTPSLEDTGYGIKYEWEYKDGKRADGLSKSYWPNGTLKYTRTWKDGEIEGPAIHYHRNGQILEEGVYLNSDRIHSSKGYYLKNTYSESGEQYVVNGNGVNYIYDSVGYLQYKAEYKDGYKNGSECWYIESPLLPNDYKNNIKRKLMYQNGIPIWEKKYKNGKLIDHKLWTTEGVTWNLIVADPIKIQFCDSPWEHYIIKDFFPKDLYDSLLSVPKLDVDYSTISGFRDVLKGRVFLSNEYVERYPHLKPVSEFLNNKILWESFQSYAEILNMSCEDREIVSTDVKCDLSSTLCRPELIDDRYPFFHEIHHDHPNKKLSIIVNISKDDEQDLGTSLYDENGENPKKIKWENNSALLFFPTNEKLHGFDKIKYEGIRRIMIINFVDETIWRDKEQCFIKGI